LTNNPTATVHTPAVQVSRRKRSYFESHISPKLARLHLGSFSRRAALNLGLCLRHLQLIYPRSGSNNGRHWLVLLVTALVTQPIPSASIRRTTYYPWIIPSAYRKDCTFQHHLVYVLPRLVQCLRGKFPYLSLSIGAPIPMQLLIAPSVLNKKLSINTIRIGNDLRARLPQKGKGEVTGLRRGSVRLLCICGYYEACKRGIPFVQVHF
jgi:hypothetical protein